MPSGFSRRSRSIVGVLLLLACLVPGAAFAVPIVTTASGRVQGTTIAGSVAARSMNAYLGIPYAAPPVGPLRWRPPQRPAAWSGIRAAAAFGPHCAQPASALGIASSSEDCLYLNVYVPAVPPRGAPLPVMVWLHGGGFVDGESDDFDPDRLVAAGVIVVTLNYRLGYFGFLSTPGLDAQSPPHHNYGLLDQRAALQWVHANIAAFGGDPARTTIFGQGAGGASVLAQVLSAQSAGLFGAAIVESGAYDILTLPSLAQAQTTGDEFAAEAGCRPTDTVCLRALPVSTVLALEAPAGSPLGGGPIPAIDGAFLTAPAPTLLATGRYDHVPLIQGTNRDEFRFFTAEFFDLPGAPLTSVAYPFTVQEALAVLGLGGDSKAVLAAYPVAAYSSADVAFSAFATDAVFSAPAFVTDSLFAAGSRIYAYEFADESAPQDFLPPVSFAYGAADGSELQFIFDFFGRAVPPLTPAEQQLAATMTGYWTHFAATSTPNDYTSPIWAPFALGRGMQRFAPSATSAFFDFAAEHHLALWTSLPAAGGRAR